ncbi:hydroxylamine oxidation protein HaoB [Aquicoccus sp. G2-2]|uniref:hydroxylamine oxidation protein HaoB n=1 Tax=Aquicoccus sp. G2-2 TaxID=3092120 RepID=UPI002ADFCF5E|nr:hydroxylamine oxidation protein HaoB [Aquicoccus sp. G2-2]MEA1114625.1 hydroxylamine oxidation protein HaoB [Aquicoccus sp. G2-2]
MAQTLRTKVMVASAVVALVSGAAWFSTHYAGARAPEVGPAPYSYEVAGSAPSEAARALAELIPDAQVSALTLHATVPDKSAAKAEIVTLPEGGEVIVGWTSTAREPLLRSDISVKEELALVSALHKHLPEGSTILAMPALSARLAHFVPADYPLADAVGQEVLRIPAPWAEQRAAVAAMEQRWITDAADAAASERFVQFIDALLAEDIYGAARLQALAAPADSYIILHVRDVFDLGVTTPDRVLVSQRDFPAAGLAHDKSRAVKDWAARENFAAYAVERRAGGRSGPITLLMPRTRARLWGSSCHLILPISERFPVPRWSIRRADIGSTACNRLPSGSDTPKGQPGSAADSLN